MLPQPLDWSTAGIQRDDSYWQCVEMDTGTGEYGLYKNREKEREEKREILHIQVS